MSIDYWRNIIKTNVIWLLPGSTLQFPGIPNNAPASNLEPWDYSGCFEFSSILIAQYTWILVSRNEFIEFLTISAVVMVLFWCHLIDWDCRFTCGSRESSLGFNNVPTPIPTHHLAPNRSNTPDQIPLAHDPLLLIRLDIPFHTPIRPLPLAPGLYRYSISYPPCSRPFATGRYRCSGF